MTKKIFALLEIVFVFFLVVFFFKLCREEWKVWLVYEEIFLGHRGVSKLIAFIGIPSLFITLSGKKRSNSFGIHFQKINISFRYAFRAYSIVGPACITFWIISIFNLSFTEFYGAGILTLVFSIAFLWVLVLFQRKPNLPESTSSTKDWLILLGIIISVLLISFFGSSSKVLISILHLAFIVGLGEEFLFRGYIQSRLNQAFGKPFHLGSTSIGIGLPISAILFGLMHGINTETPSWWMLYPIPLGFLLGYLREKSGGFLTCAILHALIDLPMAFMGG